MSRRVVIGMQNDGSIGLRCSAPGFDALTAADDGHAITFDSRWTDIANLVAVGIANDNNVINNISGTNIFGIRAFYPDLGYVPFVELHRISGTVVNDDFFNSSFPSGAYFQIERTQATGGTSNPGSPLGLSALFAVYQIPVPSQ